MVLMPMLFKTNKMFGEGSVTSIELPAPIKKSDSSIEELLERRRSVRDYSDEPLSLTEISQLVWSAQGKTHPDGLRTAPSAGALYPLEVYLVAGKVEDLPAGIYKYKPGKHELVRVVDGDMRKALSKAALGQSCIEEAPAVIVITAVYERTMKKYGERGIQYAHIEVGCASENVYLQAGSLGLGTVFIGAFYDDKIRKVLNADKKERPLCIMPVGRLR